MTDVPDRLAEASSILAALAARLRSGQPITPAELTEAVGPATLAIGNALVAAHAEREDPRPVIRRRAR